MAYPHVKERHASYLTAARRARQAGNTQLALWCLRNATQVRRAAHKRSHYMHTRELLTWRPAQ